MKKRVIGTETKKYRLILQGLAILGFLTFVAFPATSEQLSFDVSCSIDWVKGELYSQIGLDLAGAGIKLPTGRFLAEETLKEAYLELLQPYLLSLRFDSSATLMNLVSRGELSLQDLDTVCLQADKMPPSLSQDLTSMTARYKVALGKISTLLCRHSRAIEPEKPLLPIQSAAHTGIIIIADDELPIHGRKDKALAEPCIFPKIWDSGMKLVYERNMYDPLQQGSIARYSTRENIFHPSPSGLEGELAAFLGTNPLRILARGVFGINPTDLIIDRDDALMILSNENNRRLLREGRILLVLNESQLMKL
jgi:hypothetical protein